MISVRDRNDNSLRIDRDVNSWNISDSLGRNFAINFRVHNGRQLLSQLQDAAGRTWRFLYDDKHCLIEVVQPATDEFRAGRRYDTAMTTFIG